MPQNPDVFLKDGEQSGVSSHGWKCVVYVQTNRLGLCPDCVSALEMNERLVADSILEKIKKTNQRSTDIQANNYDVVTIWSCAFKKQYYADGALQMINMTSQYFLGTAALSNEPTEAEIIDAIETNQLNAFVLCSVACPSELRAKMYAVFGICIYIYYFLTDCLWSSFFAGQLSKQGYLDIFTFVNSILLLSSKKNNKKK